MKIYAVEKGCYSDYHIVGVFSSRENADRLVKELKSDGDYYDGGDPFEIQEWDLDPGIDQLNSGLKMFSVSMDIDGNTERIEESVTEYQINDCSLAIWKRTKAPIHKGKPIGDAVHGCVWAKDEKHAIKITNEYRTQAIAEGRMERRD